MQKSTVKIFQIAFLLLPLYSEAQVQWVNRFNGQGDFSDRFSVVKIDNSNNIILGGYTSNPGNNQDILLVKLNPQGDTIFVRTYSGPGNGADDVLAMTLDASNNIYLTGFQRGVGTGNDFLTMKYDSSGNFLWLATYNYPADEYDQSNTIAVDAAGNVYVAGQSDSDPTGNNNDDYVTIKYDASGNQQWAVRKNGLGNGPDRPAKIVVDNSGNAYVTGRSFNGSNDDYLTIKYNPSGIEQWTKTFDRGHNDRPVDMIYDAASSSLYVTGRSTNGTNYDYATVKYDLAGNEIWNKTYDYIDDDRATAMAMDGAGNIYVTGQTDTVASAVLSYNITTIKYNPAGTLLWSRMYGGAAGGDDIPNAIVSDNAGNILVAGQTDVDASANVNDDFILLKYDASGTLQWTKTFNGPLNSNDIALGVAFDNSGNAVVTGYDDSQAPQRNGATLKYDGTGTLLWQKFYDGAGDNSDNSHALAVDNNDNVYVAGYTVSFNNDRNFLVIKINSVGDTVWTRQLNGNSSGSVDEATAIAVDNNGYVYATGYTKNSGTSSDITTVKYNSIGDTVWVRYYNYPSVNQSDRAYAIGLDASGNVYVTGRSDNDPTIVSNYDIITIKYDNAGNQQWVTRFNGAANGSDEATLIKVSSAGNIFVGGKSFNGTDDDYVVVKYNSSGAQQWFATFNSANGNDAALAMAIDNNENVYLTGYSANADGIHRDATTVKINSAGAQQWARTFNGTANGDDVGKSIALDGNGNVIIAGYTDLDNDTSTLNNNYLTVKYDNSGTQQWAALHDGIANANDEANEVAVDASDNIYVTGQSDNGGASLQNYDYVTIKYSPAGADSGHAVYNGTGNASDVANTLMVRNGYVYVTGGSYGTTSQRDLVTVKYGPGDFVSVNEIETPVEFSVYPNPLSGTGFISVKGQKKYSAEISDITGKIISVFPVTGNSVNRFSAKNISAGIYFLSLRQDGRNVITKKLMIY